MSQTKTPEAVADSIMCMFFDGHTWGWPPGLRDRIVLEIDRLQGRVRVLETKLKEFADQCDDQMRAPYRPKPDLVREARELLARP